MVPSSLSLPLSYQLSQGCHGSILLALTSFFLGCFPHLLLSLGPSFSPSPKMKQNTDLENFSNPVVEVESQVFACIHAESLRLGNSQTWGKKCEKGKS